MGWLKKTFNKVKKDVKKASKKVKEFAKKHKGILAGALPLAANIVAPGVGSLLGSTFKSTKAKTDALKNKAVEVFGKEFVDSELQKFNLTNSTSKYKLAPKTANHQPTIYPSNFQASKSWSLDQFELNPFYDKNTELEAGQGVYSHEGWKQKTEQEKKSKNLGLILLAFLGWLIFKKK